MQLVMPILSAGLLKGIVLDGQTSPYARMPLAVSGLLINGEAGAISREVSAGNIISMRETALLKQIANGIMGQVGAGASRTGANLMFVWG